MIGYEVLENEWRIFYVGCVGGGEDGWHAHPGPDPGECQGEFEDPEAGSQEVPQPNTLQGQYIYTVHLYRIQTRKKETCKLIAQSFCWGVLTFLRDSLPQKKIQASFWYFLYICTVV